MEKFVKWSFFLFIIPSFCFALNVSKTTEAFKPNHYQNYLSCLALCGKRHIKEINTTLLSGEIVVDWVKEDKFFGVCDNFCQDREKYIIEENHVDSIETIPTTEFDRLEVVCIERESILPLKIQTKLFIQANESVVGKPLYVVETWRSLATNGAIVKNSITGRYFTFSDRFTTPYTFSNNPNQENFYIRVFVFTSDGPTEKSYCSGPISVDSIINFQQKPMTLALRSLPQSINNISSQLFLQWSSQNTKTPPQCNQVVKIIMDQQIETKSISLDSSHLIPLPEINENFTYKIKLAGLLTHQSNSNANSISVLIIESMHGIGSEEDWAQALVSYSGLILTICIVILLILVCVSCFLCCRKRRKSRSRTLQPDSFDGSKKFPSNQFAKNNANGFSYSVESSSSDNTGAEIPPGLNRSGNDREILGIFSKSKIPQIPHFASDEQHTPTQIRNLRYPSNITSTPINNDIYLKYGPIEEGLV